MTIQRQSNEIIIRLPANLNAEALQRFLDFIMYQEATSSSAATQESVDQLAKDVNKGWWERNKDRFSGE